MAQIEPVSTYHRILFPSADDAHAAERALIDFLARPETIGAMVGPGRAVLWSEGKVGPRDPVLYASDGALRILHQLVPVPSSQVVEPNQLPATRALIVGDDSDWDSTGGRPA